MTWPGIPCFGMNGYGNTSQIGFAGYSELAFATKRCLIKSTSAYEPRRVSESSSVINQINMYIYDIVGNAVAGFLGRRRHPVLHRAPDARQRGHRGPRRPCAFPCDAETASSAPSLYHLKQREIAQTCRAPRFTPWQDPRVLGAIHRTTNTYQKHINNTEMIVL